MGQRTGGARTGGRDGHRQDGPDRSGGQLRLVHLQPRAGERGLWVSDATAACSPRPSAAPARPARPQYLGDLGCELAVFKNDEKSVAEIIAMEPKGIMVSPGPGRPEDSGISLEIIEKAGPLGVPIFGVCMGHQVRAARPRNTERVRCDHRDFLQSPSSHRSASGRCSKGA